MTYPLLKPKYYSSLFIEIRDFIKNPKPEYKHEKTTRIKIYDTIGLYVLKLLFLIPVVMFFALVYDPENVQKASMAERFSPLGLLLVGGVVLPLVEEIAFRLSLRFKPIYLAMSASVVVYYVLTKLVYATKISAVDESFVSRVLISLAIGIVLYPIVSRQSIKKALALFWAKHFRAIYYGTCILFACIHVAKYELILLNIVLLPILTLPQLMSALINGYTRVSFGFQYPVIFHMCNNFVGIGLSFLPISDLML